MFIFTSFPIIILIFWMVQNLERVNSTILDKEFKTLDEIHNEFEGIKAKGEMAVVQKELEKIFNQSGTLWKETKEMAKMVKERLAEREKAGLMPRKLRWMNEELAGLMDPFLLYNDGLMELATKHFSQFEEEMKKAGMTQTVNEGQRSSYIIQNYLEIRKSKKGKMTGVTKLEGNVDKIIAKQWNELSEIKIPKLRSFIQNCMHNDNDKIKVLPELLDRYSRLHLIVQLKNAGIRMVNGIRLFWWPKWNPKVTEKYGTDCCSGAMEAAYESIGSWLDWMGENGNGHGHEGDDNQNIRTEQMVEQLSKLKLDGAKEQINDSIFKELTGRTNFNDKEDIMEWQTLMLLDHILRIYYEEEKKINRKPPNSPAEKAIDDHEDDDDDDDDSDDDDESHPPKKRNGPKTWDQIVNNLPYPFFDTIFGPPDKLRTMFNDLDHITKFEDTIMNGLMAEVKGLANWAEIRKNCVIKICKFSEGVGQKVEEAINEMREVNPEYEFGHIDLTVFYQPSLMDENILLKDSFTAKLFRAIDEVKARIPKETTVEDLAMRSTASVAMIEELKHTLKILNKWADILKYYLQRARNIRQLFTPKIQLIEEDANGKEGKGKGSGKEVDVEEGKKEEAAGTSKRGDFPHWHHQQKRHIQEIYQEEFECAETMKMLRNLSLEAFELHIWLKSFDMPNLDDQIKSKRQLKVPLYFGTLKTFLQDKMHIRWEEHESLLDGLNKHIRKLVMKIMTEKMEKKKAKEATGYSSLVDVGNCHDGLAVLWEFKLMILIVPVVENYNKIMSHALNSMGQGLSPRI